MRNLRGQASIEYLIIVGFVTFLIIGILGVAFFYSGLIKDRIRINQVMSLAGKVISESENVFYAGEPSKTTLEVFLPSGVEEIQISENNLIFSVQTSTGKNKLSFSSNVPITGNITNSQGLKKIQLLANPDEVVITQV